MTDYNKIVEALRHVGIHQDCNECEAGRWHNEFDCCLFKDAADAIEELQAQLPKRGEWVGVSPTVDTVQCSICGGQLFSAELETPYCPYCGAKMEETNADRFD